MTDRLSQPQIAELAEAFAMLANEADPPVVSLKQVPSVLRAVGMSIPPPSLQALTRQKGHEGSDGVNFDELLRFVSTGHTAQQIDVAEDTQRMERVKNALTAFDAKASGTLELNQLRRVLGSQVNAADVEGVMAELTLLAKDGYVTLDDVAAVLSSL